jgi:cytochrome P450
MLYPLFWEKATKMTRMMAIDAFEKLKATGVMDVEYWAPKATLDIIGVAGLGRDFNTLENSGDELVPIFEYITTFTPEMGRLAMCYTMLGETLTKLLQRATWKKLTTASANLRHLSEQLVRGKHQLIQNSDDKSVDTLSLLIKSNVFSDSQLVDQLLTVLAAG